MANDSYVQQQQQQQSVAQPSGYEAGLAYPNAGAQSVASNPSTSAADGASILERIRTGTLIDLLLDAECGRFASLGCLCDPTVRDAIELIAMRFDTSDKRVLYRAICGCAVRNQVITVPTSSQIIPASYTGALPVGQPAVSPQPAAVNPVGPATSCNAGLPPKGSYTAM